MRMVDLVNKLFDKSWNYRNRAQILKRLQRII